MKKQRFISEKERQIWIKETQVAIGKIENFNKKYPKYADDKNLERQVNFLNNCINNYEIVPV